MYNQPFTANATAQLRRRHNDPLIDHHTRWLTECADDQTVRQLKSQIHSTFPRCVVDRVRQVNRQQMYGMYLLRKEEMETENESTGTAVKELVLYHVTTEDKGVESLNGGLDWRRTKRSRYGRGVSFSDDADYADYYANYSAGEERRVIIVCAVLVCRTWTSKAKKNYRFYSMTVPPGKADTTVSPNGRVYVKYNDFETYPLFLVYYRRPDRLLSRYFSVPNTSVRFVERHADARKPKEEQLRRQREEERREQERREQERREQERREQERREQERREQERREQQRREQEERYRQREAYARQQEISWQEHGRRQVIEQQLRYVEETRNNGCLIL